MTRGIVRARDQVAFWREAVTAEEDDFDIHQNDPPISTPPAGVPEIVEGPGSEPVEVIVPKSNKFKGPANQIKKIMDVAPEPGPDWPEHSHAVLKNYLNTPAGQGFAKTYLKPQYHDALKAHLGDEAHAKLLHHMPKEHHEALTTHAQKPAPNSNKFKLPANQLKKLLDHPNTTPNDVQSWMDSHKDFVKGYLHNPAYEQAVKGHVGEKNYEDWKQDFQPSKVAPPAKPSKVDQVSESIKQHMTGPGKPFKELTQEEFFGPGGPAAPGLGPQPKPSVGAQLKALKPDINAEDLDTKLKSKTPEQIKKLFDKTIEGYPDIAEGLKKIYDENYGGKPTTPQPPSVPAGLLGEDGNYKPELLEYLKGKGLSTLQPTELFNPYDQEHLEALDKLTPDAFKQLHKNFTEDTAGPPPIDVKGNKWEKGQAAPLLKDLVAAGTGKNYLEGLAPAAAQTKLQKTIADLGKTGHPMDAEFATSLQDIHDKYFGPTGQMPSDADQWVDTGGPLADEQLGPSANQEAEQHQVLADAVNQIFPNHELALDQMDVPQIKAQLENWQQHLRHTPALAQKVQQVTDLYDQHFGQGAAQPLPPSQAQQPALSEQTPIEQEIAKGPHPQQDKGFNQWLQQNYPVFAKQSDEWYAQHPTGLYNLQKKYLNQQQGAPSAPHIKEDGNLDTGFMMWFAENNNHKWAENPAQDKDLIAMLKDPNNKWTQQKVKGWLKSKGEQPSAPSDLLGDLKKAWPEMADNWAESWWGQEPTDEHKEKLEYLIKGNPDIPGLKQVYDKYFGQQSAPQEIPVASGAYQVTPTEWHDPDFQKWLQSHDKGHIESLTYHPLDAAQQWNAEKGAPKKQKGIPTTQPTYPGPGFDDWWQGLSLQEKLYYEKNPGEAQTDFQAGSKGPTHDQNLLDLAQVMQSYKGGHSYVTDVPDYKEWEQDLTQEQAQDYLNDPEAAKADFEKFLSDYHGDEDYDLEEEGEEYQPYPHVDELKQDLQKLYPNADPGNFDFEQNDDTPEGIKQYLDQYFVNDMSPEEWEQISGDDPEGYAEHVEDGNKLKAVINKHFPGTYPTTDQDEISKIQQELGGDPWATQVPPPTFDAKGLAQGVGAIFDIDPDSVVSGANKYKDMTPEQAKVALDELIDINGPDYTGGSTVTLQQLADKYLAIPAGGGAPPVGKPAKSAPQSEALKNYLDMVDKGGKSGTANWSAEGKALVKTPEFAQWFDQYKDAASAPHYIGIPITEFKQEHPDWQSYLTGPGAPKAPDLKALADEVTKMWGSASSGDLLDKSPEQVKNILTNWATGNFAQSQKEQAQSWLDKYFGQSPAPSGGVDLNALLQDIQGAGFGILDAPNPDVAKVYLQNLVSKPHLGPKTKQKANELLEKYFGGGQPSSATGEMPYEDALALVKKKYPYFGEDTNVKDLPSLKEKLEGWLSGLSGEDNAHDAEDFLARINGYMAPGGGKTTYSDTGDFMEAVKNAFGSGTAQGWAGKTPEQHASYLNGIALGGGQFGDAAKILQQEFKDYLGGEVAPAKTIGQQLQQAIPAWTKGEWFDSQSPEEQKTLLKGWITHGGENAALYQQLLDTLDGGAAPSMPFWLVPGDTVPSKDQLMSIGVDPSTAGVISGQSPEKFWQSWDIIKQKQAEMGEAFTKPGAYPPSHAWNKIMTAWGGGTAQPAGGAAAYSSQAVADAIVQHFSMGQAVADAWTKTFSDEASAKAQIEKNMKAEAEAGHNDQVVKWTKIYNQFWGKTPMGAAPVSPDIPTASWMNAHYETGLNHSGDWTQDDVNAWVKDYPHSAAANAWKDDEFGDKAQHAAPAGGGQPVSPHYQKAMEWAEGVGGGGMKSGIMQTPAFKEWFHDLSEADQAKFIGAPGSNYTYMFKWEEGGDVKTDAWLEAHDQWKQGVKADQNAPVGGSVAGGPPKMPPHEWLKQHYPHNSSIQAWSDQDYQDWVTQYDEEWSDPADAPAVLEAWMTDKFGDKAQYGASSIPAKAAPPYDADSFIADYKQFFPNTNMTSGNFPDAKQAELAIKDLMGTAVPSAQQKFQQLLDKWFPAGGGAPAPPPPFEWDKFGPEFKALFSGSGWANTTHSPEEAKAKLKGMLETFDAGPHAASEKTQQAHALYNKWFGGGAAAAAAPSGPAPFDAQAIAQGLADADPSFYSDMIGELSGNSHSWHKSNLEALIKQGENGEFPDEETAKYKVLYNKFFGSGGGAPAGGGVSPFQAGGGQPPPEDPFAGLGQIKQVQESEEDPGVSAPFKSQEVDPEDFTAWQGNKPSTPGDWKDFAKWWGATKLTPEDQNNLYYGWFPAAKKLSNEQIADWFQSVYDHHSKPATGDLVAEGMPAWATTSWALGKNAEKEWPAFQQWATKDQGLPTGLGIKQKLQIWNGLNAADKKEIAENYLPAKPIDTGAVVGALAQAFPDSDFSKWAAMPQGTLKTNVELLAKSGYDEAIPVFNKFFGGKIPMPKKVEKAKAAPPAFELPMIPPSKLPDWVKTSWGENDAGAKKFTAYKHWADSVGIDTSVYNSQASNQWQVKTPKYLQVQISSMPKLPWTDMDGFKAWQDAQPTLLQQLAQMYPELDYSGDYSGPGYYFKAPLIGSSVNKQRHRLGNMIEAETDETKKAGLLGLYHYYFGDNKTTLSQSLGAVYPEGPGGKKTLDWDSFLKSTDTDGVMKELKKRLKAEKDPERWIQLVDIWGKYFPKPTDQYKISPPGVAGLTNYLKNHTPGDAVSPHYLKAIKYWKEQGQQGDIGHPNHVPADYDPGPYIKGKLATKDLGGYAAYHGWTPPGVAAGEGFKSDPAMLGSTGPTYAAPEKEAKSTKEYERLVEVAKQHKSDTPAGGGLDKKDYAVLGSGEFQNWWAGASRGYKNAYQNHPAIALDDFENFMQGGKPYGQVPGGEGAFSGNKYLDVSPFGLVHKKNDPNAKGLPGSQLYNPPKSKKIKFPQVPPTPGQETLPLAPGEQLSPEYAPLPLYRLMRLKLDEEPNAPNWVKGAKNKELHVQQQKARLRRIDEIVNGTLTARKHQDDLADFKNFTAQHKLDDKAKEQLGALLFPPEKDDLFSDDRWAHFEEFAKSHNINPSEMHDLAKKLDVMPPPQDEKKGNYDHPELAQLILDYLENGGGVGASGVGTHWTRDFDKAHHGLPESNVFPEQKMRGTPRQIPLLMHGLWGGQGETETLQGAAFQPHDPTEVEQNLMFNAPVLIHRLQIRGQEAGGGPGSGKPWGEHREDWHDVMDHLPSSLVPPGPNETAKSSGKPARLILDKPSLAQALQDSLGGGAKKEESSWAFSKEDWDYLTPGHRADMMFNELVGKLGPHPEQTHPKELARIRKIYQEFFVGRPEMPVKPHTRRASLDSDTTEQLLILRMARFADDEYERHVAALDDALEDHLARKQDTVHTRGLKGWSDRVLRWSPARLSQQKRAINRAWAELGGDNIPQEGKAVMLGGVEGSGKGELYDHPLLKLRNNYLPIDVDHMKHIMAEEGMIPTIEGFSPMESSALVHKEAADMVTRMARRAYKQKRNVVWDTTMNNHRATVDTINEMRKEGYGTVDSALMKTTHPIARKRTEDRHRVDEDKFRDGIGKGGGRWVPKGVSRFSTNPTPGSGYDNKPEEVFHGTRHKVDNSVMFNGDTYPPTLIRATGPQWGHPSDPAPQFTTTAAVRGDTVRGLLESYEHGGLSFEELVPQLATATYTVHPEARDLAEHYHQSAEHPDDNNFFWVTSAHDLDLITDEQYQQILAATAAHHQSLLGGDRLAALRLAENEIRILEAADEQTLGEKLLAAGGPWGDPEYIDGMTPEQAKWSIQYWLAGPHEKENLPQVKKVYEDHFGQLTPAELDQKKLMKSMPSFAPRAPSSFDDDFTSGIDNPTPTSAPLSEYPNPDFTRPDWAEDQWFTPEYDNWARHHSPELADYYSKHPEQEQHDYGSWVTERRHFEAPPKKNETVPGPVGYSSPKFRGIEDRPRIPPEEPGEDVATPSPTPSYHRYFSPNEVNPPAVSPARAEPEWTPEELEQETLPGEWPRGRSTTLYRGMGVPMPDDLDHPQLGDQILDAVKSKRGQEGGAGTHWSTDPSVAHGYSEMSSKALPVRLTTQWKGAGEDPYRTKSLGDFPTVKEMTLLQGADTPVTKVEYLHPETKQWTHAPHTPERQMQASLARIESRIERLAAGIDEMPPHMQKPHWLGDYDGYGQLPGEVQDHWQSFLKRLDDDEIEKYSDPEKYGSEGKSENYSDDYEIAWDKYLEDNGVKPNWEYDDDDDEDTEEDEEEEFSTDTWDDDEDEDYYGYDDDEGYGEDGEWINGPPEPAGDRPAGWPNPAPVMKNRQQYFPPHGLNPESTSGARSETDWGVVDHEQSPLPMSSDESHVQTWDEWPHDPEPIPLYRGFSLLLDRDRDKGDPFGRLRRSLWGERYETGEGSTSNKAIAKPHPLGFDNPQIGSHILDLLETNKIKPKSKHPDLGRHWTTDHDTANTYSMEGNNVGVNPLILPVKVRAQWKGLGEDPYRTNTAGDWPEENEITMTKGAPMHVDSVQIRHPHTGEWHEVLDAPSQRAASIGDIEAHIRIEELAESWA